MHEQFKLTETIRQHEITTEWEYQKTSELAYKFFDIFNEKFFDKKLSLPIIAFSALNRKTLGCYRLGHNSIGAKDEITLNIRHIGRPKYKVLSTVLHEALHLHEVHTKEDDGTKYTNRHSKYFRQKSKEMGIESDRFGRTLSISEPFLTILKENGVDINETDETEMILPPKSKMKKWSCKCMNIRSAKEVNAVCNNCGNSFEEQ